MERPRRGDPPTISRSYREKKEELIMGADEIRSDYNPVGGYLFNPPVRCDFMKHNPDDGAVWCDLAFCVSMCKNRCQRYLNREWV